ncbi:MAG: hypothetical protein GF418_17205 [Chitinivibrionales bacterium]|nr:hypothetical protein [Chitinivibrionales bacterium]MBD3397358.1 hypothetical protein [Chitinivibrionales bacterium]
MKPLKYAVWLIAAGIFAARADSIVVLGSSTAAGIGPVNPDNAWVNRYREYVQAIYPGIDIINLAVGGYTTYHIQPTGRQNPAGRPSPDPEHNITKALSYGPGAIVINLPSNDAAYGYGVEEQLANYDSVLVQTISAVLAKAFEQGVPVWIATTQPRNLGDAGRQNLMDVRDSTFARFGGKAIDFWTGLAETDGTIKPLYNSGDNVHLNDTAHALLFGRVVDAGVLEAIVPSAAGFALAGPGGREMPAQSAGHHPVVHRGSGITHAVLYDVRGRAVGDARGRMLSSGSYLYRLEGVGTRAAQRTMQRK